MFQYDGIVNYVLGLADIGADQLVDYDDRTDFDRLSPSFGRMRHSHLSFSSRGCRRSIPTFWAAAKVDGASPIRRFIHVTLPLMRPFILVVLVIRSMDLLRLFDEGFVLTGGAPARETER